MINLRLAVMVENEQLRVIFDLLIFAQNVAIQQASSMIAWREMNWIVVIENALRVIFGLSISVAGGFELAKKVIKD